jgi:NADPH:quinone reductase-like Zn-dependent oxidoreductase
MKAFALDEFGAAGSVRELPDPEPGEGQVRVRVAAAGLNPFDNWVIQGAMKDQMQHRFPLIPGGDASGTVDAVGSGVTDHAVGDDVFGSAGKGYFGEGTMAEFVTMSVTTIAEKPASLSHDAAAAIPVAGVTAFNMIEAAPPARGQVVAVIGATGGVGSYYVQLANARGARVIAICSTDNVDYARSLGAGEVVDYSKGDVVEAVRAAGPDGIDLVADMHRDRELVTRLAGLVPSGGRVVSVTGGVDADALSARGIEGTNVQGRVATAPLEALAGMLERKEIVDPEIRTFPLERANEAFAGVSSGHTRGKIVVTLA